MKKSTQTSLFGTIPDQAAKKSDQQPLPIGKPDLSLPEREAVYRANIAAFDVTMAKLKNYEKGN